MYRKILLIFWLENWQRIRQIEGRKRNFISKFILLPSLSADCKRVHTTQTHCSKSSFFVQKFNFDFPRKLSIFWGVKNSWKCWCFGLFSCWQLWFHEKNCQKNFGWKTRENEEVWSKLNFWTKIWLFEWCA